MIELQLGDLLELSAATRLLTYILLNELHYVRKLCLLGLIEKHVLVLLPPHQKSPHNHTSF